jgi:hypothetical protein
MTRSELLVQRFVDQELTAEERVDFLRRIPWDEGLRQHAMEVERLEAGVALLQRPPVPDDFVARVIERTHPAAAGRHRLADVVWRPRIIRWNLATAAAAACVTLVAGALAATALREAPQRDADTRGNTAAASSGREMPVLVRLVVVQPGATTVHAAGDFNGWDPSRTPLEPAEGGAWTVTLPLEPGRYEYMFVVDGRQWIADPFAPEQADDGFGSRNAVIDVRGVEGESL